MLLPYNKKHSIPAFGLYNTGVLCYFNSLTQCLLSLPAFNEAMNHEIGMIASEYNKIKKIPFGSYGSSYDLATAVKRYRDNKFMQWNIDPHRQEDIHEGFILMMEALQNRLDPLFNVRYRLDIKCTNCNTTTNIDRTSSPPELSIDMSNHPYRTKQDVEKYIKGHIQVPEDYKCDYCSAKNTRDKPIIFQKYSIGMLSTVIILVYKLNQYLLSNGRSRITQYFPEYLDFDSVNGPLKYKLVSYAEQFGSLGGGHYNATSLRLDETGGLSVYKLDDMSVYKTHFEPTHNTYIIFYHLL